MDTEQRRNASHNVKHFNISIISLIPYNHFVRDGRWMQFFRKENSDSERLIYLFNYTINKWIRGLNSILSDCKAKLIP